MTLSEIHKNYKGRPSRENQYGRALNKAAYEHYAANAKYKIGDVLYDFFVLVSYKIPRLKKWREYPPPVYVFKNSLNGKYLEFSGDFDGLLRGLPHESKTGLAAKFTTYKAQETLINEPDLFVLSYLEEVYHSIYKEYRVKTSFQHASVLAYNAVFDKIFKA